MPRYVILRHELPPNGDRASHWDVMLEDRAASGEIVLKTWAVDGSPDEPTPQRALRLVDHRAVYLTYEGPVSGGRGEVSRWDEGIFDSATTTGESLGLRAERIEIVVAGRQLRGRITLKLRQDEEPDCFEYRYSIESGDNA